ncbi:LLM class flavin-dependent oxidoreductase [Novosphingobium resinovorum]
MALRFYWHLSSTAAADRRRAEWGDGDRPWVPARDAGSRRLQINHYDYLTQVARAAELTGFDGIVIPDEPEGEEPWIVTGNLLRETRRVQLVTAVAPGSASGVYHAKMAASVQRFSGDRQGWLIDPRQGPEAGDAIDEAEVPARRRTVDAAGRRLGRRPVRSGGPPLRRREGWFRRSRTRAAAPTGMAARIAGARCGPARPCRSAAARYTPVDRGTWRFRVGRA